MRSLTATLALCLLLTASASASAPNQANRARLDATVRYLQEAQNLDGGFGGSAGGESSQGFSAWVALALAAAGINPRCQARPGGADAFAFLVDHFDAGLEEEIAWPRVPTTALERELMVVNASGADPHEFAGHDLVAEVLARARDDGSLPYVPGGRGEINDTAFAILALAPVREPAAAAAVQRAAGWLIAQQDPDGGWAWGVRGDRTEADLTGAAIQALRAAGRGETDAERAGLDYLRAMQNPDGGFPEFPGEAESNVASTAWAAQGIWAAGQDPETWLVSGRDPLSFMASLQQPDGRLRWKASADLNGIWMTAYAAPAFAGQTWPIPASPCAKQPSGQPQPGQGEGTQSGEGTIAGGGGAGAPLFSRPKPGSRGRTPGGARILGKQPGARDHSSTRRGENALQSTTTVSVESAGDTDGKPVAGGGAGGQSGGGGSAAAGAVASSAQTGGGDSGREVSGVVVGKLSGDGHGAFGAPGLHSAGADGTSAWPAAAIAAAALLCALAGSRLERERSIW